MASLNLSDRNVKDEKRSPDHPEQNSYALMGKLYRLRLLLVATAMLVSGLAATVLDGWLLTNSAPRFLRLVVGSLSDLFLVTGAIGLGVEFFVGRDRVAADTERLRSVLRDAAPNIRDAVIAGFIETPSAMSRVATHENLDRLAANALALRLGDEQFAHEIYADVRDLAIRAPERWYDVDVSIRLSAISESSVRGAALLDVLVTWEYTTTPSHAVQCFACTSDRDEFHDLTTEIPATSSWFLTPRPGVDPSRRTSFELLTFSVDGEERAIRRTSRKTGQTYTVSIGEDVVTAGKPARIRHTYRAVAEPANHRLFVAISQPARNVSMDVDYSAAGISRMSVTDLVPSVRRPYVSQLPAQVEGKELTVDVPGWVQAGTGFTFVWTLASEEPATSSSGSRPASPRAA